jgi:hypothetical protein
MECHILQEKEVKHGDGSLYRLQPVDFCRGIEAEAAEHRDLAGDWGQRAEVPPRSFRALR